MRVLLVEDDPSLGTVLQRALSEEGHAVDLERTLSGARRAVAINAYHLIVLDLGLPDGDGLALCREARAASNPARVLVLTARDATGDKVLALDAGADDYLTKPFDFAELAARIRALLRRTRSGVFTLAQAVDACVKQGIRAVAPWRDQVAVAGLKEAAAMVRANGLRVTGL